MYDPQKPSTEIVRKLVEKTWDTKLLKVTPSQYTIFEKTFSYPEIDHTDGLGTKGFYHWKKRTFEEAVVDSLAMNLNDLLLERARAYKLQNHLVFPKDDFEITVSIMKKMVAECKKREIVITGGETSIHNFPESFDISMTVSGFIKKITPNVAKKDDLVIGVASNGLHSNGFTLIRKLFKNNYRKEFTEPTKIYYDELLPLVSENEVNGMMHITGGAYSKLKKIISKDLNIVITNKHALTPQRIFFDVFSKGVGNRQMYLTFNCGIGFILTASEKDAVKILKSVKNSDLIGHVEQGDGQIKIKSAFDNRNITL